MSERASEGREGTGGKEEVEGSEDASAVLAGFGACRDEVERVIGWSLGRKP